VSELAIRPRFRQLSKLPPQAIIQKLQQALEQPDAKVKGTIINQHIILRIPLAEQHYWSPQLDLEIEESTNGSLIKGLFGPNPSVWFMYIFFYSVLGFVSMMVMIMGFSQLNLGLSARILWVLPITGLLFLLAFSTAKAGQKLGEEEMQRLHGFLMTTIV